MQVGRGLVHPTCIIGAGASRRPWVLSIGIHVGTPRGFPPAPPQPQFVFQPPDHSRRAAFVPRARQLISQAAHVPLDHRGIKCSACHVERQRSISWR